MYDEPHGRPVLRDVLVDHRVGEPGQRKAVPVGLGRDLGTRNSLLGEVDRLPGEGRLTHALTPTRTLRNRAGADGWPVWPVCPGCPLPQLGVPHATMSLESMSIEDQ